MTKQLFLLKIVISMSTYGITSYVRNSQKKQYLIFGEMRNIF